MMCSDMHFSVDILSTGRKCPILDVFLNITVYQILIFIFKGGRHDSTWRKRFKDILINNQSTTQPQSVDLTISISPTLSQDICKWEKTTRWLMVCLAEGQIRDRQEARWSLVTFLSCVPVQNHMIFMIMYFNV